MPRESPETERLALILEVAELRVQLSEAQDHCVEMAIDAGHLHMKITQLQAELARVRADRDAWRAASLKQGIAVAV